MLFMLDQACTKAGLGCILCTMGTSTSKRSCTCHAGLPAS